ncbi:hypothetical protein ACP70R_033060 [Stipagrostis hirtigluma subsp. patula]
MNSMDVNPEPLPIFPQVPKRLQRRASPSHLVLAMSTAAMEVDAPAAAPRAATGEAPTVAARVAAVCDMIEEQCRMDGTRAMSARRAAAISAMISDIIAAATAAAEGRPRTGRRRKRRMGSACWYQEVRSLGEGGYGAVVRARHRTTGQDVAVKSPLRCSRDDVGGVLREACFMAACHGHPSHVTLLGITRAPGTGDYSLVMDYVGPTLADVLDGGGEHPFREADVRRVMRQLLAGAQAMHERGIVHRDLKPSNILVGDGGAVKICDYGLAKSTAEKTPPYCAPGTNGYMAPEVLLWNEDHDALADTWSLGCVMAELLTGEPPFDGEDETEQLHKIFDVLGVPGKRAWQALKPQILDGEVQQWRARQRRLGNRSRLRELVPEELLSKEGFEVLKGLLTCDPKKRLTAAAALRCPWFTENGEDVRGPCLAADCNIGAMAMTAWSLVRSFVGRALQLVRPKKVRYY